MLKWNQLTATEQKDWEKVVEYYAAWADTGKERDNNAVKIFNEMEVLYSKLTADEMDQILDRWKKQKLKPKTYKHKARKKLQEDINDRIDSEEEAAAKTNTVLEFPHVIKDDEGKVIRIIDHSENTEFLFESNNISIKYNELKKELDIDVSGKNFHEETKNTAILNTLKDVCSKNAVPYGRVEEHIVGIGNKNVFHPVRDWMKTLTWDGTSRIEALLDTVELVDPSKREFALTILKKWLIMGAAAILKPNGISPQGVLILVGSQGLGKTTWIKSICPNEEWLTTDMNIDPHNKDNVITFVRNWIVELGEIDASFRRADIAALKSFITRDKDEFRAPYGKKNEKYPRRTIFYASVNSTEFLHDDENRRFWPFEVKSVNAYHDINVNQLWAEAKALFEQGGEYWLSKEELDQLNVHNKTFSTVHPLVERIMAAGIHVPNDLTRTRFLVNCTDLIVRCGGNSPTQSDTRAVAKWLKQEGFEMVNNGKRQWRVGLMHALPEKSVMLQKSDENIYAPGKKASIVDIKDWLDIEE